MQNEFLIVHKDVLPPYYAKVAKAVYLMEHETKSVSDVCKELDISRSTFYKYKDKVFELSGDFGRKAILSFKVFISVGSKRATRWPLRSMRNLVKFHMM